MKTRSIKHIAYAAVYNMGGFPVRQPFPNAVIESADPFLLLHHAEIKVNTNRPVHQSGVGPHPHRGFSPVTFIFKGGVHHRDSRGNDNVVYEGGVQWMNAGRGIIHSERPPEDIFQKGGMQEIIQLWVNTPAKHKMDQPAYFPAAKEEIPFIISPDNLVQVNIVAGLFENIQGPVNALSPLTALTVKMQKAGNYIFSFPAHHNSFLYILHGKLTVNKKEQVQEKYAVIFNQDEDAFILDAEENTEILIASAEPLNEPVASHGPFVMNNETEILEAFRDYNMGKMGILIEN